MPYMPRDGSATAAIGVEAVRAVALKPSGSRSIESPWLIQTDCSGSRPAKSRSSAVTDTTAGPNSLRENETTSPPRPRSEEHTSELQSRQYLVCRLLLEK